MDFTPNFGNEHLYVDRGKYKNMLWSEVVIENYEYVEWYYENIAKDKELKRHLKNLLFEFEPDGEERDE